MDDVGAHLSIGEVAARLAVPVRTVRFWSDQGLAGDLERTPGGYRLYDATAIARLDLVASLRHLGVSLPATRALLERQRSVAEVAAEHVGAIDAQVRLLKVRRALLCHLATTTITTEELRMINDLAALSARERQHLIDDFVERAFAEVPPGAPATNLAASMRTLPPDLPEEATSEQAGAWLELAALAEDPGFAERVREVALAGPNRRTRPAQRLVTFTDARVERYHHLLEVLNGRPGREPGVPAVRWIAAALRA